MTENEVSISRPDLLRMPSAVAQGGAAPARAEKIKRNKRMPAVFRLVGGALIAVVVLMALGVGFFVYALSQGPVSNAQMKAQLERSLSSAMGENHTVRLGDARIAFGRGGLLVVSASDLRVLEDGRRTVTAAGAIDAKLDLWALLRGKVVAKSVAVSDAAVDLLALRTDSARPTFDPLRFDMQAGLTALAARLKAALSSVSGAGLDSITVDSLRLLGVEEWAPRLREASLRDVRFTTQRRFRDGLYLDAVWRGAGQSVPLNFAWRAADGADAAELEIAIDTLRLPNKTSPDEPSDASFAFDLTAPFTPQGEPLQATGQVRFDGVQLADARGRLLIDRAGGEFNIRVLTEKNQIELERSPIQFATTQAMLLGGLRLPKPDDEGANPRFELIANDLAAYGMLDGAAPRQAAALIDGQWSIAERALVVDRLELKTPNGAMTGNARLAFSAAGAALKADLAIAKMPVSDFKQFWPYALAPKVRQWADQGLAGGTVRDATVSINLPAGLLGQVKRYEPQHMKARVPVFGTRVKTAGTMPPVEEADVVVILEGRKTSVALESGSVALGGDGKLSLGPSQLDFGDYTNPVLPLDMALTIDGPVRALAALGARKPLGFTSKIGLDPKALKGRGYASVDLDMTMRKGGKISVDDWSAKLRLTKASSSKPVQGRKFSNADLRIDANPQRATIDGTARIDGVTADVAMIESIDGSTSGTGSVKLVLDDKQRKAMGISTGGLLSGPVTVELTRLPGGKSRVEADLAKARLDLPWIGWRKGKGIAGRASFTMKTAKGTTTLSDIVVKGKGFSAAGSVVVKGSTLRSAKFRNVRLNATDDFDVAVTAKAKGFAVDLNARSYDGRSLIRSFMSRSASSGGKGGLSVSVNASIDRLGGFRKERMTGVEIAFAQRGSTIGNTRVSGLLSGGNPTSFALKPVQGGMQTTIATSDAGALLRFLDVYTKINGGRLEAELVRDRSSTYRGQVRAFDFTVVNEPRLAKLLAKPQAPQNLNNREEIVRQLKRISTRNARVDSLTATVEKGPKTLFIKRGRLSGGDASAAFEGRVYNADGNMKISGTFLPGRGLNRLVSKIPLFGLAFGEGQVNGLLGITFKLAGRYNNPRLQVNPLSIIAPGVFRQIFKF